MKVGIKWHVRAWITDIIVGSANWQLTGMVVPIHSQLVVKKTHFFLVKKRKGSFRNISLRYWERKITLFHFCKWTLNRKMSSGFTKASPFRKALNTALALLISKIFLLVAGSYSLLLFSAIHTTWKILLCILDFLLPFRFLIGEQSKRRIIGLTVWDRNVGDLLLNAKGSILLSIHAHESQAHQFSSFHGGGSEKPSWF